MKKIVYRYVCDLCGREVSENMHVLMRAALDEQSEIDMCTRCYSEIQLRRFLNEHKDDSFDITNEELIKCCHYGCDSSICGYPECALYDWCDKYDVDFDDRTREQLLEGFRLLQEKKGKEEA